MLLEVRGALTAEQIEARTKHNAAAGTPLAEALRASAKVEALEDGSYRYKVLTGPTTIMGRRLFRRGSPRSRHSMAARPASSCAGQPCQW